MEGGFFGYLIAVIVMALIALIIFIIKIFNGEDEINYGKINRRIQWCILISIVLFLTAMTIYFSG